MSEELGVMRADNVWRFEGKVLCPGCEEVLVAEGTYCGDCMAVEELLDLRWRPGGWPARTD